MLPLKHIWRICSNTETVSYSATNLSVPEGFCSLYALQEYNGDFLSYFVLQGSPSIDQWPSVGLPRCKILIENRLPQRILCPANVTSFPNLKIFSESSQDTLFHVSSTCSKEIINKKIRNSCHGFSCGWTSCNGIQRFFLSNAASTSDRSRVQWDLAFCHIHHLLLSDHSV